MTTLMKTTTKIEACPSVTGTVLMKFVSAVAAFLILFSPAARAEEVVTRTHALAEFTTPKYAEGFAHFDYVNPEAPKGGGVVTAEPGSFDSLNSIILRGQVPRSIGLIADSLFVPSGDELEVVYGLIAETAEYPEDKSWVVFNLRPEARFHDGHPVTSADFVFGWNAIEQHGRPFLKSFLEDVEKVEALDEHRLKVSFKTKGEMKPLIRAASILSPEPEHWWTANDRDISKTTLEPPLTSGAYKVKAVDPGRSITYERVTDYWGKDLPVNIGQNNFDTVRTDFYRDDDVMFEAFKGGAYDFRQENRGQRWTSGYDIPQVREGRIEKRTIANERPLGAQGIRFNMRRPQFSDPKVRLALAYLYDFEWLQKNILYGQYRRVKSNFPNSEFGASGPPTPAELAILEKYRGRVPEEVFTTAYEPPSTDGSGNNRDNVRKAMALFRQAGYETRDNKLVNARTGQQMRVEFLDESQSMVRVVQPYVTGLQRVGIDATIRIVDSAQYQARTDDFDFDSVMVFFNFFPPPGTEQRSYFGSAAADVKGSANYAGIKDPVVDALIEEVIAAKDYEKLQATSRALDRVLLWQHAMIPQWYNDQTWIAYWTRFGWPERKPRYDTGFPSTWWSKEAKAASR
jgi:microcin C transport system substrate-binding protein